MEEDESDRLTVKANGDDSGDKERTVKGDDSRNDQGDKNDTEDAEDLSLTSL